MLGSEYFDPSMPWECKLNEKVQRIAGNFVTFVDDICVKGLSVENFWQCERRLSAGLYSLGTQDVARKSKILSLSTRACAGRFARSNREVAHLTVTQSKCDKGEWYLKELIKRIGTIQHPKLVDNSFLMRVRRYFNLLAITHDAILPLFKGSHNTIDR